MNRYKKQMPIDRYEDMELRLQGWDFDMERLKETERGRGGVSLSPPKVPRADFTNVHPASSILKESEWCHYGGLPNPNAYL